MNYGKVEERSLSRSRRRSTARFVAPHKHPEDLVYTVISSIFYIGVGDEFDASKLEAYPPGGVIILPGITPHFHWAKSGEYVTQVTAMRPLGLDYLSAKDDPRNNNS
jgi:hypothetical protein